MIKEVGLSVLSDACFDLVVYIFIWCSDGWFDFPILLSDSENNDQRKLGSHGAFCDEVCARCDLRRRLGAPSAEKAELGWASGFDAYYHLSVFIGCA